MLRSVSIAFALLCAPTCVLTCVASCATAAPPPAPAASTLRARDFYPLSVGNSWTYQMMPAPPGHDTDEVRILDRDQAGFFVDNKGGKLAPRTDGIFDGQRFLIEEPIEVGHEWMAIPDPKNVEHFSVKAVGVQAVVPAGSFVDCVQIESKSEPDRGPKGKLAATWTYAPNVGLVKFTLVFTPDGKDPAEVGRMELVKYQVKNTE